MGLKFLRSLKWMLRCLRLFNVVNFMVQEGGKFIYLALRAELHCQFVLGVARWPQVGDISERGSLIEQFR